MKGKGKAKKVELVKGKGKAKKGELVKGKGKAKKGEVVAVAQDFFCIFCSEQYVDPPSEDWIQCKKCKNWCHENCALITANNDFVCDLCR